MSTRHRYRAALIASAALILLNCSEPPQRVVAPEFAPSKILGGHNPVGLLSCSVLPADSVTQVIGPDGGTINVGPHTFIVPPGALDDTVSITAVAPSDSLRRVSFQPEGLNFNKQAALYLNYDGCDLLGSFLPKRVAYISGSSILDFLPSLDDTLSQRVRGKVSHFSDYAVAW